MIYGDTDSVMVLYKGLSMVQAWAENIRLATHISQVVLAMFPSLILNAEKVARRTLLLKKKHYVMHASTNPNKPTVLVMDCKGIESKRRDKTLIVKKMFEVINDMMPSDPDADASPAATQGVISANIRGWLQKIINNSLGLEMYETTQTSKITYKKQRPGHMLVFDRHNSRVESGEQEGLYWDAGHRVPYVVLLGKKPNGRLLFGSDSISGRTEEPAWVTIHNNRRSRRGRRGAAPHTFSSAATTAGLSGDSIDTGHPTGAVGQAASAEANVEKMVVDRVYYLGLCTKAVVRLLPFHLPHVDEMCSFATQEVTNQLNKAQTIDTCFKGGSRVMPDGMPRASDGWHGPRGLARELASASRVGASSSAGSSTSSSAGSGTGSSASVVVVSPRQGTAELIAATLARSTMPMGGARAHNKTQTGASRSEATGEHTRKRARVKKTGVPTQLLKKPMSPCLSLGTAASQISSTAATHISRTAASQVSSTVASPKSSAAASPGLSTATSPRAGTAAISHVARSVARTTGFAARAAGLTITSCFARASAVGTSTVQPVHAPGLRTTGVHEPRPKAKANAGPKPVARAGACMMTAFVTRTSGQ